MRRAVTFVSSGRREPASFALGIAGFVLPSSSETERMA